jgi:RecA-family ATPase
LTRKEFSKFIQQIDRNSALSDAAFLAVYEVPPDEPADERGVRLEELQDRAEKAGISAADFNTWYPACEERYLNDPESFHTKPDKPSAAFVLCALDEVEEQPVDWLFPGVIPRGEITVIGADGGTGKGFFQAAIIAALTNGTPCPMFENRAAPTCAGKVLYCTGEDPIPQVLVPRMRAAGADVHKINAVDSTDYFRKTGAALTLDADDMRKFILEYKPDLVIIDPLQSFLGDGVDMAKRNEMRKEILPFRSAIREVNAAGILTMHTNKRGQVAGRQRLADSSDMWDIARAVFMLGKDKSTGTIYASQEKNSYSPTVRTALFKIEGSGNAAKAILQTFTDKKDLDFIAATKTRLAVTREAAQDAILDALNDSTALNMPSEQLRLIVTQSTGCSESTFRDAKRALTKAGQIYSHKVGGFKKGEDGWLTCIGEKPEVQKRSTRH